MNLKVIPLKRCEVMDKYKFNHEIRDRVLKKDTVSHNQEKMGIELLPFNSKSHKEMKKFNLLMTPILGEFTRAVSGVSLAKEATNSLEVEQFIENLLHEVANLVEVDDEDSRYDLFRFLKTYLFSDNGNLDPVHPSIFKFIPTKIEKSAVERKMAIFSQDVLVTNKEFLSEIFNTTGDEDIVTSLILEKLGEVISVRKHDPPSYRGVLPEVSRLFEEDITFMAKHKEYFLEHYAKLFNYYTFLYLSQLTMKLDMYGAASYDKVVPLYFGLEWESLNKSRPAADQIRILNNSIDNLFVHINVLAQLSHVNYNDEKLFLTYADIVDQLNSASYEENEEYLSSLNNWIAEYCSLISVEPRHPEATSLDKGFRNLMSYVKVGVNEKVRKDYGSAIQSVAEEHFIKNRGNLGKSLNVNKDFLLMITALAVKDNRLPLNQLFDEYEKRGLKFDRYSRYEITHLLDSLNILDKKSDSGDAQYVKPIL